MIRFPTRIDFEQSPQFSVNDVLGGVSPILARGDEAGLIRLNVDGTPENVRFYGLQLGGIAPPLV